MEFSCLTVNGGVNSASSTVREGTRGEDQSKKYSGMLSWLKILEVLLVCLPAGQRFSNKERTITHSKEYITLSNLQTLCLKSPLSCFVAFQKAHSF
jgi:hypothetical protein